MFKYYSVLRPVGIGTYPKEGMQEFRNYEKRVPVPSIDRMAWGEIYYNRKLTGKEEFSYDLVAEKGDKND